MKKSYSKSSRQGLPGGPNEMFQKVKGIIVSERGQWDFPGMTTLVPTDDGRITMRGVPYPVLGQDETGYTQMMYPEQEYQFPGNKVIEWPKPWEMPMPWAMPRALMAKRGGALPKFQNAGTKYVDPNDFRGRARYKAYKDSLDLYNRYVDFKNVLLSNPITSQQVARRYNILDLSGGMFSLEGVGRPQVARNSNNVNPNIKPIAGWSYQDPYQSAGDSEFLAEYKKPVERVKYKLDQEIVEKQKLLKEAGLYKGKIDGIWGTASQKAWDNYQKQFNVAPAPTNQSDQFSKLNRNFAKQYIDQMQFRNPISGETEERFRLITPAHEYIMNIDQYGKLLPTDSVPQHGNFLYRTNRKPVYNLKKYGGSLNKFQNGGDDIDDVLEDDSNNNVIGPFYELPEFDVIALKLPIYATPQGFYERNKDLQTYFSEKDINSGIADGDPNIIPIVGNNPILIKKDFSDETGFSSWNNSDVHPEYTYCTSEGCTARANRFISSQFISGSQYFQNPDKTKEYFGATFSADRPPTSDEIKRYPYAEGDTRFASLDAWDQVDAAQRNMPNNVLYSNIYVPKNGKITESDINKVAEKNIPAGEIWKKYKIPIGSIINVGGSPGNIAEGYLSKRNIVAGTHTIRVVGYTDTGEPLVADYGLIRPLSLNMYGPDAYVAGIITVPGNEKFTYDYFVEKSKLRNKPPEDPDYYLKDILESENVESNPLKVFSDKKYSKEFVDFNNSIINEENELRSKLNISKEKYDQYAKIALTIAGTETEFGKGLFYKLFDKYGDSTGITQLNKKNVEGKYEETLKSYKKGTPEYDAVSTILYIKELDKYKKEWSQKGSKAQERPFRMKEGYSIKAQAKKAVRDLQGKSSYGYEQSGGRLNPDTFTDEKGVVELPFKQPWQSEEDFTKEVNDALKEAGREDLRFAFEDGKRTIFRTTLGNTIPDTLEDMVFYSWQSPSSYIYGDAQGKSDYYIKAKTIYRELFPTKKKYGGSLPKAQNLGQFNPQVFKPNPLTGQYSWEQKPIKKTNLTPKMQPAVRATTNVQRPGFNLDRDNRLLDAGLQNTNVSSNPLSPYVHTLLDAAGMVPILGEPADFANALLYNYEGDLENAATSTAGMVPVLGMVGTGKRLASKAGKGFKSKIDWGKWNPEIPNNKALMDEYLAIEQKAKADGTWMKNADGTPSLMPDGSKPTPELWIQSQSKNWEKAYGKKGLDAIDESYRGVGFSNSDPDFSKGYIEGDKAIFSADRNLANNYAWGPKMYEDKPILTPNDPLGKSGVFHLIHPKGKTINLNTLNSNWTNINLRGAASKINMEVSLNELESQLKILKDLLPKGVTRDNKIRDLKERIDLLKKNIEDFDKIETDPEALRELLSEFPGRPSTDDIAEWLPITNINSIILRDIYDGGLGNVTIFNNKYGKYAKSAVGNNGMFDRFNPNIYKSLAPIMGLGAVGTYGANQLMNQQPESYQGGGSKLNPYGMIRTYPGESGTGVYGDVGLSYDLPTGTSPYLSNQFAFEPGYGSFINPGFGIEQSVGDRGSAYIGANMFDNRPMINAGIKYRFDDGGPLQTDPVLNFITQQQPRRFSKSKK